MKVWAQKSTSAKGFTIVELLIVVVVIAILAAITIVSYNGITNRAKEAEKASTLATWKKKSEVHKIEKDIVCPANYVFVYGNSILGTSDFCVMKYEARIQGNDNGATTYANSMVAESRSTGTPWVYITQAQAIAESAEAGGHLLTEAEWMTIAADVLSVKYNWSGGAVGSGYVYSGHNDDSPANAITGSTNDDDGYVNTGNSAASGANQKRTLYLSSGDVIWDLSGNVYEWTQQAIGVPTLTMSQVGVSGDSSFVWRDWVLESLSLGNLSTVSRPGTLATYTNPVTGASLSDIGSWNGANGVGQVGANYASTSSVAFIRGGRWYGGSLVGVLSLGLNFTTLDTHVGVGFRVAR